MANQTIVFSVIIPTLNEEKYLPILLRSLVAQSYKDFEVIIVDGKSRDKTQSVAQKFVDSLSLRILHSKKDNVSFQRNMGAKVAHGDYFVFFDADVTLPRNFLEKIASKIAMSKSLLLTTWMKADSYNSYDYILVTVSNIGLEVGKRVDRPFAPGFNTIIHKRIFRKLGGYNQTLALSEDHEFVSRCVKSGIKMAILRTPRLTVSMRRFRQYGYFAIIRLYAQAVVYNLLEKPMTKTLMHYPMGGHLYTRKPKTFTKRLQKLEKRLWESIQSYVSY